MLEWSLGFVSLVKQSQRVYVRVVKKDETIAVRISGELRDALERERQRMSRKAGAEVKSSSAVRAILEKTLIRTKTTRVS